MTVDSMHRCKGPAGEGGGGAGLFYISIVNIHNKTAHDIYVDGVEWEGPEVGYQLRSSNTLIKGHVYRESMKLGTKSTHSYTWTMTRDLVMMHD